MAQPTFDQAKAEAFVGGLLDMLNQGALALLTSIGHRTGLFDTMAEMEPSSSYDIADEASLDERYVREWLGGMVVGRFIEYDPKTRKYTLPPEHAAFLTRNAVPDNVAVFAQYIPTLGMVEDEIVDCFHNGGGVPYEAFPRFHHVMAEDSGQTVVAALIDNILPLVDGLAQRLDKGIDVLDVGCGSGRALCLMAETFPNSRFTGYDISEEAITYATGCGARKGLSNIEFVVKDVTNLTGERQYDLITAFDAIHDQAAPDKVLAGIARCLRPDGVFFMQDIAASSYLENNLDHPVGPLLYTISTMHCMTVSLAQGGMGLGTMWGEEKAREMIKEAGFSSVETRNLDHDFQNNFYVIRK